MKRILASPSGAALLTGGLALVAGAVLVHQANFGVPVAAGWAALVILFTVGLPTVLGVAGVAALLGWRRRARVFCPVRGRRRARLPVPRVPGLALGVERFAGREGGAMTRRDFLKGTGAATLLAGIGGAVRATEPAPPMAGPVYDCHVHLFGVGSGDRLRHKRECWISPTQKRHWNYRFLRRLLRIGSEEDLNAAYVRRLVEHMQGSGVTRAWLVGYDCRYDEDGLPDERNTSSVYVPNEYVFRIAQQHRDLFLPCPSINPRRADWREELAYCVAEGARVLEDPLVVSRTLHGSDFRFLLIRRYSGIGCIPRPWSG